jgi:molecular chaperone GrpE (heat shock protein)
MKKTLMTMAEYARAHNLAHASVRQAVREGRLRSNGKRGRECRVIVEDGPEEEDGGKAQSTEYKRYLAARCRKVKADAKLAELQEETRIREIREKAITEFIDSLEPIFAEIRRKLEALPNAGEIGKILVEMMNEVKANIPE